MSITPKPTSRRRNTRVLTVSLSPVLAAQIKARAQTTARSVSQYFRDLFLADESTPTKPKP